MGKRQKIDVMSAVLRNFLYPVTLDDILSR